jgi:hypothetical protein
LGQQRFDDRPTIIIQKRLHHPGHICDSFRKKRPEYM